MIFALVELLGNNGRRLWTVTQCSWVGKLYLRRALKGRKQVLRRICRSSSPRLLKQTCRKGCTLGRDDRQDYWWVIRGSRGGHNFGLAVRWKFEGGEMTIIG